MIEEMLTQELPNLVDERRFRRREPENFERDEFGRVSSRLSSYKKQALTSCSANGPKRSSLLVSNLSVASICVRKL